MSTFLGDALATTDALAEVFSDRSVLAAMLQFEVALVRAAAAAGEVPSEAAAAVEAAAQPDGFDARELAREARLVATPVIPFVAALTARVRTADERSAGFVHWGATSQDVTDTALVLLLKRAHPLIAGDHRRLEGALRELSSLHARTVQAGRTLLQPAVPITFGLKAAVWTAAIVRAWDRLDRALSGMMIVQLGGAAGTRAALGASADRIVQAVAAELELRAAPPWHTDRDRLGAVVTACGLYVAALAKAARDIALMTQPEVGEAAERGGGSSAMPHKQNPAGCAVVLAASARAPGLVSAFLTAMVGEHERGVGGIQAEWPIVAALVQSTGAAAAALAAVCDGLTVDSGRMTAQLEATAGAVQAEHALMLLARGLGRGVSRGIVEEALARGRQTGVPLAESLAADERVAAALTPAELASLRDPREYLGSAEAIRQRLLSPES